jgi:hypothetical protein
MAVQVSTFRESPTVKQGFAVNTRLLGTLGMVFSSGMFLDLISDQSGSGLVQRLGAFAGLLFTIGWFSNVLGLRALEATGKRLAGKILLGVELFGVTLAALFQVFSIVTPGAQHLLFTITDVAWPLSMLTLMIIGIVVAIRGGLRGAARFVPLLAALWLPPSIILMNTVDPLVGQVYGGLHATVAWFLLGFAIRNGGGFGKRN